MWLHIVIFVILFFMAAGYQIGWLHVEQIGTPKGRKLFFTVALIGNIMGLALTCTKGGSEIYQNGYELKREKNSYEEKFMVSVDGEKTGSVYVQIPEKEMEEEELVQSQVLTEEEKREQQLLEFVAKYNSGRQIRITIICRPTGMERRWSGKCLMIIPEIFLLQWL